MKVVVAHNRYSSAQPSGENAVVSAEIEELTRAGVTVIPYLRDSDEIASLPPLQRAGLAVSPSYARRAQHELRGLIERHRPDVLHLHNPYPLISPWAIRTAHAHRVPVVHTMHNFRQTCVNGLFYRDGADCHDCVGRSLPTPAIRHSCYRGSRAQSAVMATTLAVHRGTWASLDRVLALTPIMAEYARGLGLSEDRIVIRPNSVADPGRHSSTGDGFLYAGRLSAEKGISLLLEAWDRHPDGELGPLRVAGDGPLAEQIRHRATSRGDIEFLGRLDKSSLVDAMRQSSVVVVPSTWDEVCPMVAIEALANARPVLGTARGGLPWLVGEAGWTVPATADALAAAFTRARAEAAAIAPRARSAYESRFTPDVSTQTLLGVYRAVAPHSTHP
jgi:glycosyltransferase involved in cell wall biosynthesis